MSEKKRTWWYKPIDKIIQKWGGEINYNTKRIKKKVLNEDK